MPIYPTPGICKNGSEYSVGKSVGGTMGRPAVGRYIDCDQVRFVAGAPEKIGGYNLSKAGMVGVPRASTQWKTTTGGPLLAVGTTSHLYKYDGTTLTDITPMRSISSGTLGATPLTTTNGNVVVAVADASQTLQNGDWVLLQAGAAVAGITLNGYYQVSARSGSGYSVTTLIAASSGTTGGGTVTFSYPRVTLSGPFAMTITSATVTVTHSAHGATTGDYVMFGGASAVGGLTISGEYPLTVVDGNSYTIQAASAATSTASGGGSVSVTYDVSVQNSATTASAGFGTGPFGVGPFGLSSFVTSTVTAGWSLSAYGSLLLAAPIGGTIYVHDPVAGGRSYPVLNAPNQIYRMFVTPERFIIAAGQNGNPMQIAWPDQNDMTNWTSTAVNTANSGRQILGGNNFIGGISARSGVSLLFSDKCAFALTYAGDNLIYHSDQIANNAGIIGAQAAVSFGSVVYWMGDQDFWMWSGSVQPMPSDDIRDYVFRNLNRLHAWKSFAATYRAKKEIWFFYPSQNSTEVDSYVIYHTDQQCWSIGKRARATWVDADLFNIPFACDIAGNIYQHEIGLDADGSPNAWSLTFAPIDISNGDRNMDVFGIVPDFQRLSGSILLDIQAKIYPQDPTVTTGEYTITPDDSSPRIDIRENGKMMGFKLSQSVSGGDFRLGLMRLDLQPSGVRL